MIANTVLPTKKSERILIIITGLSGAGKSSVMGTLADLGFYCVDNLPLPLFTDFLNLANNNPTFFKIALGIDARGEQFLNNFITDIQAIRKQLYQHQLKIIFVNAREQTILKRFQETRRNHPLADNISLANAIEKEKSIMAPIMALADVTLDTDSFSIHELRHVIHTYFAANHQRELLVNLVSFGFKYGVPLESNLVYDLRFLPNPHFIPALKDYDGRNELIQDFLFNHQITQTYWQQLVGFLQFSLEKFHEEGRFFATVALGCTGGKHRSVSFVEKIKNISLPQIRFIVTHRDIGKE